MSNFVPKPEHIRSKVYPGFFYVRPAGKSSVTVARIAGVAAGRLGGQISTANMVKLIAMSPWNHAHFAYGMTGPQNYTNYGFPGPQYVGKGGTFPPIWIPTIDGKDPEQVFGGPKPSMVVVPGEEPPKTVISMIPGSARSKIPGSGVPGVSVGVSDDGYGPGDQLPGSQLPGDPGMAGGGAGYDEGWDEGVTVPSDSLPWGWMAVGAAALAALGWKLFGKKRGK